MVNEPQLRERSKLNEPFLQKFLWEQGSEIQKIFGYLIAKGAKGLKQNRKWDIGISEPLLEPYF